MKPLGITPETVTHRRVLSVAIPIVISNATVPILGAVDTGVVGQLGEAAPIGAVGIGAIILASIYWFFGFLRMGTSGLVAQARGADEAAESGAILTRGIMIGIAGGVALFLLQVFVFAGAFFVSPATPEVEEMARAYLSIRIWGAPAAIALFAINGWLIAMEKTRSVLILQLWMNGLNACLDLLFVLSFGWGVEGVAVATLIAEWTGLGLGLWLCGAAFAGEQWKDWARVFDPVRLRRMMAVSSDIIVRSLVLNAMFILFVFRSSAFGNVPLAGTQILLQFLEITAYALDGFAFAAEALVGQAMGAKERLSLRKSAILTSAWGLVAVVLMALFFATFGPSLIDLMATSQEVRVEAKRYLWWVVFSPIVGIAAWMLDGIFIGATRTRPMRNAAIEAFVIYLVALWFCVAWFGIHGLWLALYVSFVARAVTLGIRYPALERAADGAARGKG